MTVILTCPAFCIIVAPIHTKGECGMNLHKIQYKKILSCVQHFFFQGNGLRTVAGICICGMMLAVLACARATYYSINLHYTPQKAVDAADSTQQRYIITVAGFNDERNTLDKSVIGKRIKSDGAEIKAVSQQMQPSYAVASAVKDFFYRHGYTVYGGTPDWDIKEKTIESQWGTLVVGGDIEELDIVCTSDFANVQYDAKVRLRIVFADVQHKKILYTRVLESSSSFRHVRFQEQKLEDEINNALSTAVEKIFEDNKLENLIEEITRVRSEVISR